MIYSQALVSNNMSTSTKQLTAYGWGDVSNSSTRTSMSRVLKSVIQVPVSKEICQESYSMVIGPSHICAGQSDASTCKGDSGGPLMSTDGNGNYVIEGITSFGAEVCGTIPSGFTRVASHVTWINSIMNQVKIKDYSSQLMPSGSIRFYSIKFAGIAMIIFFIL